MNKLTFILQPTPHPARRNCWEAIKALPDGYVVTIQEPKRTVQQNAMMWAMLGEVSKQVIWHGQTLSSEEWKHVFTAALKRQKVVPGLDGGFVVLGQSTSRMSKKEISDLVELMRAFGSDPAHFVDFKDVEWEMAS